MHFKKIILLLFFAMIFNNMLISAENNEKQTVISHEEKDSDTKISREDMEIIGELDVLEYLDMFQGEDIDFLKEYDMVGENINDEGSRDE